MIRMTGKISLGLLAALLAAFFYLPVTNELAYQVSEVMLKSTLAMYFFFQAFLFSLILSAWSIYRDGWFKGLTWSLFFIATGSIAGVVYILWNLRGVETIKEGHIFFHGRHMLPKKVKGKKGEAAHAPGGAQLASSTG